MKKIVKVFFSLFLVVLMTGCKTVDKEQTLVCTDVSTEEGMSIEQVISMTYKNDKLKHMKMEVNTTIVDPTVQENWEQYKTFMAEDNEEFNKDGISLTVEVNDQNYEYNTILDIDVENASEEALNEQGFSDLKDDDSTLEISKKKPKKITLSVK